MTTATAPDPTLAAMMHCLADVTARQARIERLLAAQTGARLTAEQMAERLGIHRNTLSARVKAGTAPPPMPDGKWLLAAVMEWESHRTKGQP